MQSDKDDRQEQSGGTWDYDVLAERDQAEHGAAAVIAEEQGMQELFDGAIPVVAVVREHLQQVDETKARHSMEAKPVTLDAIKPHQNTSVDLRQLAAADVGLELVSNHHIERLGTSIATSVRTTYRTHSQCRRFVA